MDTFDFRFSPVQRLAALALGVRPSTACVAVSDTDLVARFGPWVVRTPLANVESVCETGGYSLAKVMGGARLSLTDRGLTFATNTDRGLCLRFREPVPGIEPSGRIRHPGLTVTVADVDGLRDCLVAAGARLE